MKKFLSFLLAALLLCALICPTALADQDSVRYSVVRIVVDAVDGNTYIGSGFAVGMQDEPVRYFVTNRHMVADAMHVYITFGYSNDLIPANVVDVIEEGKGGDLAILSIEQASSERQAAVLRPFDISKPGGPEVWAYGFPSDADIQVVTNTGDNYSSFPKDVSSTKGNISRYVEAVAGGDGETIQHTALISGGNSGGPLVDKNGYVVGVNYASSTQSDRFLAVSVNEVVRMLDQNGIPYVTDKDVRNRMILRVALAAIVVAAIIAVIALLLKRKSGKNSAEQAKIQRSVLCDEGALKGQRFALGTKTRVGRDSKRCQIVFPNDASGVSGVHLTISIVGDQVKVRDEGSSYGTWLDDRKLVPKQDVVMHRGQKLYLGSKKQVLSLHS